MSDVQWHHYTAFCQRPSWQMTGSPCPPGIRALWGSPSHRQLVSQLPHYQAAAVDSGAKDNLLWQIQNEGPAAWLVQFSRARKIRQATNSLGTFVAFENYYEIKLRRIINLQTSVFGIHMVTRFNPSKIKKHTNSRTRRWYQVPLGKFSSRVWNSWYQLFFLLTEWRRLINYSQCPKAR